MLLELIALTLSFLVIGLIIYIIIQAQRENRHHYHHRVGGCKGTRWGCCSDGRTSKKDPKGTNCPVWRESGPKYYDNMFKYSW